MNSSFKNLSSALKSFIVKLVGEFAGKRRVQEPSLISFLKLESTYGCVLKGFSRQSGGNLVCRRKKRRFQLQRRQMRRRWDLNVSARVSLRQDSFERKEG